MLDKTLHITENHKKQRGSKLLKISNTQNFKEDEELVKEIEEIASMVRDNDGSLIMKGQRILEIPKAIQRMAFDQIVVLDIRGNEIVAIEENVCKNLSQVRKLDARNNRIREISSHIKAMMMLQNLRLDSNCLEELPQEIGELCYLEELSFSDNKVTDLSPALFAKVTDSLKVLNFSDNKVKHLP
jgi:Leucine-rich repeat (LRR) protein